MFGTLPNSILYAAVQVKASFSLPALPEPKTLSGTGFFVRTPSKRLCLVTNRHVLDITYQNGSQKYNGAKLSGLQLDVFVAPGGETAHKPLVKSVATMVVGASPIRFAQNYFEDVACVVHPLMDYGSLEELRVDYFIDHSLLADDAWFDKKLSISDLVVFPGFPPWHDKLEGRPILRTGTIASDPRANYSDANQDKGRRIAYEAFSFGGSSGSPVIATQKGLELGKGLEGGGHREAKVVGVNAGHLTADIGAHSGISYFIRSSAVLELTTDA